jgi:hypothetical protein
MSPGQKKTLAKVSGRRPKERPVLLGVNERLPISPAQAGSTVSTPTDASGTATPSAALNGITTRFAGFFSSEKLTKLLKSLIPRFVG